MNGEMKDDEERWQWLLGDALGFGVSFSERLKIL